jgi:predicted ester cyclase
MKSAIALFTGLLSAACAASPTRSPEMTTAHPAQSESNARAAAVRRLYEQAINERRLELLSELVSPAYVGPRGEQGSEGFARTVRALTTGIPDLRFELETIVADSAAAAVRWRWSGHHTGPLFGMAASNKAVTNSGIALYYFDGAGKIVRSALETDRLGLLQQLGLVDPSLGAPPVPR